MIEYGLRFTRSVNWPPSSQPTYPGGEPISFETECFSMYADMSKRTRLFSLPNRNAARARDVMGTPVQRATTSSISSLVTQPVEESSRLYFSRNWLCGNKRGLLTYMK